jgi:bifunctional enzyme CysN/CysC
MVRELVAENEFLEIYVDTPIEECVRRDPKGLYARATRGQIKNFTGIDSPYEAPEHAELVLRTSDITAEQAAADVIHLLEERGVL